MNGSLISRLEPKHWTLIAAFIGSTATVVAGLDHWSDILNPPVTAGLMMQLATLIGAVFAGAPPNPHLNDVVNPGRRGEDPKPPDMGAVTEATRRTL